MSKCKRKAESSDSANPSKKIVFKTVVSKRGKKLKNEELSKLPPPNKKVCNDNQIETSNQFETLITNSEEQIETVSSPAVSIQPKKERIPPIVVSVSEFAGFRQEILNHLPGIKFSFQIAKKGDCRVLPGSLDARERLLKYLTEKRHKFFTYDDKSEPLFKVVLQGLPSGDKSLEEIKNEINDLLGFAPVQVIKMKKRTRSGFVQRGIPRECYLVHFRKSELNNLKGLEKASLMSHVHVTWEHFRKPGGNFMNPTQCRQCQEWGHGTKHCHMDAKCMICGSTSHAKDACPVKEAKQFKCANCAGNHKSNFWDCPSRKRVVEFRQRQMNGNVARTRNSSGRISNNTNFQSDRVVSHTHQRSTQNHTPQRTNFVSATVSTHSGTSSSIQSNGATFANVTAGRQQGRHTNVATHGTTENPSNVSDSGNMSEDDFNFLNEQLNQMIDAMFKTQTMAEAVKVGISFTNKIVIKLRFGNGSK